MRRRGRAQTRWDSGYGEFPPYVSVGERRARAAKDVAGLRKKGRDIAPVVIEGRAIATTFWGKAWCQNLERYSDYENRLPRGRSYVRSGAVVDLQIAPGKVTALVRGSELYTVGISIVSLSTVRWKAITEECSGKIDSVIELLSGKLSSRVMEVMTRRETGLFPAPKEIRIQCSCPDWATLCKHAAAVLYGVGARLDRSPELLFRLRGVDPEELSSRAATFAITSKRKMAKEKVLGGDLASVFGIDLEPGRAATRPRASRSKASRAAKVEGAPRSAPASTKPPAAATAVAGRDYPPKKRARIRAQ